MRRGNKIMSNINQQTKVMLSNESNEWYTPEWVCNKVREVMGSIELDPASCEYANKFVKADNYYTPGS